MHWRLPTGVLYCRKGHRTNDEIGSTHITFTTANENNSFRRDSFGECFSKTNIRKAMINGTLTSDQVQNYHRDS